MRAAGFRIPVSDLTLAVAFYRDELGFIVAFQAEAFGWATIVRDGLQLGLYVPGKGGGTRAPGGTLDFAIHVADLDGLHHEFASVDGRGAVVETADGMRLFDVVDPSGNTITFAQDAAGAV